MVAIPVFRSRVAPVLNWCSKVFIFPENKADDDLRGEMVLLRTDAFELLRLLHEKGVRTLICGALSPELLRYGEHLGFSVIYGVAGEVGTVLRAYRANELNQPCFWLPGYRCQCRYRDSTCLVPGNMKTSMEERNQTMPGGQGKGGGRGQGRGAGGTASSPGGGRGRMSGMAGGPEGFCVCLQCGTKEPHKRGIPCPQVKCPQCGQAMVRE